jgi:ribose/xylose/arabinose/galactoside ABC-type transport system permease subunit
VKPPKRALVSIGRSLRRHQTDARAAGVLAVIWVGFALAVPGFATKAGIEDVLGRSVVVGIMVVSLTLCLLVGEIDLSIGTTMALGGVVFALVQSHSSSVLEGLVVAIAAGCAVGSINAILVCILRVNSFIATLGMLFVAQSVALVLAHGAPVAVTAFNASASVNNLVWGPITEPVLIYGAVVVLSQLFITFTTWGREIVATGGSADAARSVGIPVHRRRALAFVLSGGLAAGAGMLQALTLLSGDPSIGQVELLTAVAAAFLGGVSLKGGRGSVVGAAMATLALSGLAAGLEIDQIDPSYEQVIFGIVIILVGATSGREAIGTFTESVEATLRRMATGGRRSPGSSGGIKPRASE